MSRKLVDVSVNQRFAEPLQFQSERNVVEAATTPLADIVAETHRIIECAENQGIILRLFGGMAIRSHSPSATHRNLERKYADIDFMGLKKQAGSIKKLFPKLGYVPREIFNAMAADKRLIFNDIEHERRVDIFLDIFKMAHRFDFRERLSADKPTIPLADLLATKLQVVQITEKEYKDVITLILDHKIGDTDAPETINGTHLAQLSRDWGIYKTFNVNIKNILKALSNYKLEPKDQEIVQERLEDLHSRIENTPKSLRWKLRAKIGEKKQWYELVEQDKEIINSQFSKTREPDETVTIKTHSNRT